MKLIEFKNIIKIFICIVLITIPASAIDNFPAIKELNINDETMKSIRDDIRNSIIITGGKKDAGLLHDLKFYKYRVKTGDTFWKILTNTSLNIDTLLSVNDLTSPSDVRPGRTIFIPNMRGIIYQLRENESLRDLSARQNVDINYIRKVNKINGGEKEYLFIPCGEVTEIERSLFLGVGFANPLIGGRRTSTFGNRIDPFNKRFQFHCGIDLACPRGSKVYSSRDGVAAFTGYMGGYGRLVIIRHQHGYKSYYGHLSTIYVKAGASVKRGELLGLTGSSGRSTGPHLHFEVRKDARPVNPGVLLSVK